MLRFSANEEVLLQVFIGFNVRAGRRFEFTRYRRHGCVEVVREGPDLLWFICHLLKAGRGFLFEPAFWGDSVTGNTLY